MVTFYHQYQREKQYDKETGEEYIETTLEDIKEANELLKDVLIRKSDLLTGACRNYFESLKTHLKIEGKLTFSNREIRQVLRTKSTTLKRYHQQLLEAGMIRVKAGKRYRGYEYEIVNQQEYKELREGIGSVLDQVIMKLEKPSRPPVAYSKKSPVKNKKIS